MTSLLRTTLSSLPRSDRRDALEDLVVAQFRDLLLITDDEELGLATSYFDLGLTSLRLTEIKQRLETALDIGIDATVLFNQPTIDDLVTHLTDLLSANGAGQPDPALS
ncbi:MAG TPA: acyl carrier protein [Pseudonocardiaceae bacterium]